MGSHTILPSAAGAKREENRFDPIRGNVMLKGLGNLLPEHSMTLTIMIIGRIESFDSNPLERKYNEQENPVL